MRIVSTKEEIAMRIAELSDNNVFSHDEVFGRCQELLETARGCLIKANYSLIRLDIREEYPGASPAFVEEETKRLITIAQLQQANNRALLLKTVIG